MWLSSIESVGAKSGRLLLNFFGTAGNVYNAGREDLKHAKILSESKIDNIIKSKLKIDLGEYTDRLYKLSMSFISINNPLYPDVLKEIADPPLGLYTIGKADLLKSPYVIGVVGSRRCSEYGVSTTYRLSKELSQCGITIISGMAKGIDKMAHKGALDTDGATIAVLGCGADICYPAENREIYNLICDKGLVISEHPPGTKPVPGFFPKRNRIISGISQAVLVVEAGLKSGSLITADQALEQGRDVYAVPGNINNKLSEGTNNLIKQGALLISDYTDVLNALGLEKKKEKEENLAKFLDINERLVYDCMSFEPIGIDVLLSKIDMDLQKLQYILTMLELKKYIERLPGQRYMLNK